MPNNNSGNDKRTDQTDESDETYFHEQEELLNPLVQGGSHRSQLSPANRAFLDREGVSVESVVTMARLRSEHVDRYAALLNWVRDGRARSRIRLVRLLVLDSWGVTYEEIGDACDTTEEYGRKLVGELHEMGVVTRRSKPAVVSLADDTWEVLAADIASLEL